MNTAGGKAYQLTTDLQSVASREAAAGLSWSADGKKIAFLLTPNAILNDATQGHIEITDAASGKLERLPFYDGYESGAVFSPDGKHIAYQHSNGDSEVNLNDVYVTSVGSGNGADITTAYDRQVHDALWAADSRATYLTCADRTSLELVRAPLGGEPKRVDLGDLDVTYVIRLPPTARLRSSETRAKLRASCTS